MRQVIFAVAVLGLCLGGCGEPLTPHEKEIREIEREIGKTERETKRLQKRNGVTGETPVPAAPLPAHALISDEITQPVASQPKKRSVDVRLDARISKTDLERLGAGIRLQSPHKNRLFINYYLPGQKVGSGAWASTHFTPDLAAKIHGMTLEQANDPFPALPQGATSIAKFTGNEFLGEKALIYNNSDGKTMKAIKYKDGSGDSSQLFPTSNGRLEARNGHGEYFIINGLSVSIYDSSGLIETYTAVK